MFLGLLPGRRLEYLAADIGTNPTSSGLARKKSSLAARAIRIMTEMRDNGTIAFIGPDDTCSSEALVAAAWNLPMIAYVCSKIVTITKSLHCDLFGYILENLYYATFLN